ncbi:MAG: TSUP family transporter [Halopseudomonas sp.]
MSYSDLASNLADPSLALFALLFLLGTLAGFISAIAGAGGLLVLPALLTLGLDPLAALATNKLQNIFGTASSMFNYFRKGRIELQGMQWSIIAALIGSGLGTYCVQRIDTALLAKLIPLLLIVIALYFLFSPRVGDTDAPARLGQRSFALSAALTIGFYGGFFGPGIGSLFAVAFVAARGYNLVKATAHTKVLVFTTNITSLVLFISASQVVWSIGLCMAAGQLIGARLGSNLVITRGARLVKPMIIFATLALAVKLLWF